MEAFSGVFRHCTVQLWSSLIQTWHSLPHLKIHYTSMHTCGYQLCCCCCSAQTNTWYVNIWHAFARACTHTRVCKHTHTHCDTHHAAENRKAKSWQQKACCRHKHLNCMENWKVESVYQYVQILKKLTHSRSGVLRLTQTHTHTYTLVHSGKHMHP